MSDMVARSETIWAYQFRVVLLGDSTVGKSALLRRFTDGCFLEVSDPTVGVDFYSRLIEISPGTRIKLQLWDTAGQERFRQSFLHVVTWAEEARLHVAPRHVSFALVGQKCDLEEHRQVPTEEASNFARLHKMPFIEASAKNGKNVEKSFVMLTELIYRLIQSGDIIMDEQWDGIKCGLVPKPLSLDEDENKSCCA
nr:ras-related protein Rab-39B-like isoform X2 [Ciona intestinalis]XP_026694922.1 ras-related protein Rab-39B-like isoform X2 [Ciona intestinalis]|eukprot:XP_002127315.1 ras-related protein Rab-39B-like isoform X2 [Ciona intestinalis]